MRNTFLITWSRICGDEQRCFNLPHSPPQWQMSLFSRICSCDGLKLWPRIRVFFGAFTCERLIPQKSFATLTHVRVLASDSPFVFDLLDRLTSAAKVARSAARRSILRSDDFDSLSDATLCWLTRDFCYFVCYLTNLSNSVHFEVARILLTYDDI